MKPFYFERNEAPKEAGGEQYQNFFKSLSFTGLSDTPNKLKSEELLRVSKTGKSVETVSLKDLFDERQLRTELSQTIQELGGQLSSTNKTLNTQLSTLNSKVAQKFQDYLTEDATNTLIDSKVNDLNKTLRTSITELDNHVTETAGDLGLGLANLSKRVDGLPETPKLKDISKYVFNNIEADKVARSLEGLKGDKKIDFSAIKNAPDFEKLVNNLHATRGRGLTVLDSEREIGHVVGLKFLGGAVQDISVNGSIAEITLQGGGAAENITGLIEAGTNVTIDGTGTQADPYVINSSGGGAGITDGDKGDVIVSDSSATWTLDYDNIDLGDFTNNAGFITDYTVTEGDVTAYEAALSITESQISDLGDYLESVDIADINATGTADDTTYLRGDGTWATPAGGGSSQWTTTGSDIYYNTGNVGIGTQNPSSKLHVSGVGHSTNPPLKIDVVTSNSGRKLMSLASSEGGGFFVQDDATNGFLPGFVFESSGVPGYGGSLSGAIPASRDVKVANGAALTIIGKLVGGGNLTNANILSVRNNATSLMVVDAVGNVGIGTTSPDTKLHIDGAITQQPLSADPSDPDAGNSVTWVSDGTGSGDAGDVMMKINVGGTVKTVTVIDYSAA